MECPKCKRSLPDRRKACACGYRVNFKNVPPPPKQLGFINDYEVLIDGENYNRISRLVRDFESKTGIEIITTVIHSTVPLHPENYAYYLFNSWKLGKKKGDAILILVASKERRIETEIGFALESVVSEAFTEKLLDETVIPYFKQSKYGEGLYEGIRELVRQIEEKLPVKASPS